MKKARKSKPAIGRPAGRKPLLNLRIETSLHDRLKHSSEQSGRTISEETVKRLERSFDRQDLLTEVLTLTVGEEMAALLFGEMAILADIAEKKAVRQVYFGCDTDGNLYTGTSEGRKGREK